MCVTKTSFSNPIIFKDFKKNAPDKKTIIDLSDTKNLQNNLNSINSDTIYLKLKDDNLLKVDLKTKEGKDFFDNLKAQVVSNDQVAIKKIAKLEAIEPDNVTIENLFNTLNSTTEDDQSNLSELEKLGKENRSVSELLKKIETDSGSGRSFNLMKISKNDLADFVVEGKMPESISETMKLFETTGEWSSLNTIIELNNTRKAYLQKNVQTLDSTINDKNTSIKNIKNNDELEKANQELSALMEQKNTLTNEISNLVKENTTIGSIGMEKRLAYTSREINTSHQKLDKLGKEIIQEEKKLDSLKDSPQKLKEQENKISSLKKEYEFFKLHMTNTHKDTEHDSKFMDTLIAERTAKGLKLDEHSRKLATKVHTTSAKNNLVFSKVEINEKEVFNSKNNDNASVNLKKADEHIKKIETYNPDFQNAILKPDNHNPIDKKNYTEKISARNDYFEVKTDYLQTDRSNSVSLLKDSGIAYVNGNFEPTKDGKGNFKEINDEQAKNITAYHKKGIELVKTANLQSSVLQTELKPEINANPKTIEEKKEYLQKVEKISSLEKTAMSVQEEEINIMISDMKNKNSKGSVERSLKTQNEEYIQTAPSQDHEKKTQFDSVIDERSANVDKLIKNQDELEEVTKQIKELPDNSLSDTLKSALVEKKEKLERDIPLLKSKIAENNTRLMVLYNKHKELEEGVNRNETPQDKNEKSNFERGSEINARIIENQKKVKNIDTQLDKITNKAIFAIGFDSVSNHIKDTAEKEKQRLIKEIESDKQLYEKMNVNKPIKEPDEKQSAPEGSITQTKSSLKNIQIAEKLSDKNNTLLSDAMKSSVGRELDLEFLSNQINKHTDTQEKLLNQVPEWAKNNKEFQMYKAQSLYEIAGKKSELSPVYAFAETEPNRKDKFENKKQKHHDEQFLSFDENAPQNLSDDEIEKKAYAETENDISKFKTEFKQIHDDEALSTLNKAEEVKNNLKEGKFESFNKNNKLSDTENLSLANTSVKTTNTLAHNMSDIHPETSVELYKRSSKNIDSMPNSYKQSNGEIIKTDTLKNSLHDEIAGLSAKDVPISLKRKTVFENKTFEENSDASVKASGNLLTLSLNEADKVKNYESKEIANEIQKRQNNIKELEAKLAKTPSNQGDTIKEVNAELKKNHSELELLNKYQVNSKGAILAYSTKNNIDDANKKASEQVHKHIDNLIKEKNNVNALFNYQIDQVKDIADDHFIYAYIAKKENSKDFNINKLDDGFNNIASKYDKQIEQAQNFAKSYDNAINGGTIESLNFISAIKENIDAKDVYNSDPTAFKDTHIDGVLLKNSETVTGSKYPILSKSFDRKENWDPTISSFIKNGGSIDGNSFAKNENEVNFYNQSLLEGGYQKELSDVYKMQDKYTNRRLTEMVGLDPHLFAVNTGIEWIDSSVNEIGAFLDRADTMEMLVETAFIELATAGTGSVLALANDVRETAATLKLANKIEKFEEAEQAVNTASKALEEAKTALGTAQKAGKEVSEELKAVEEAETTLEATQTKKAEALKDVENATKTMDKIVDKKVREFARQHKIESSGFLKRSAYKGFDSIKSKAFKYAINKSSEEVFGENSSAAKLTKFLSGASSSNKFKNFSDLMSRIRTDYLKIFTQQASSTFGKHIYAQERFHKPFESLNEVEKQETLFASSMIAKASVYAVSFVQKSLKKDPSIKDTTEKQINSLNLKLDKNSKEYKELFNSLENYNSLSTKSTKDSRAKLEEVQTVLKKHIPNFDSNEHIANFMNRESLKLTMKDVKYLGENKNIAYQEELNKFFITYNNNKNNKPLSQDEINNIKEQILIQKAVDDIEPLNVDIKSLGNKEYQAHFEKILSYKKNEIHSELEGVVSEDTAKLSSNSSIKMYLLELSGTNGIDKDTKLYLEKLNDSISLMD